MKKDLKLQVFVDMDGVVSDFRKTYFQLVDSYKRKDDWNFFHKMVVEENLFSILDPLPNAKNLIAFLTELYEAGTIEKPKFLTSVADVSGDRHAVFAHFQKKEWVRANLNVDWDVWTVLSKSKKKDYANEFCFLIDDTESNIAEFQENDGFAFLYEDSEFETMKIAVQNWIDFHSYV